MRATRKPAFDMRPCSIEVVRSLCVQFHGYGSAGNNATYAFAVYDRITMKKNFFRDVADILSMNDDLMPSEFDDGSPDADRWHGIRDEFVAELNKRAKPKPQGRK
jgi:hypothetical protein